MFFERGTIAFFHKRNDKFLFNEAPSGRGLRREAVEENAIIEIRTRICMRVK